MSAEVSFTKRAAAELSRCFNGLTVRGKSGGPGTGPPGVLPTNNASGSLASNTTVGGGASLGPGPPPTPGIMVVGNSGTTTATSGSGSGSSSSSNNSSTSNSSSLSGCVMGASPGTLNPMIALTNPRPTCNSQLIVRIPDTPGGERRKLSRGERSFRIREFWARLAKPTCARELWTDGPFLGHLFQFLPLTDRCPLTQVCKAWRDALYLMRFWRHLVVVLRCRDLRSRLGLVHHSSGPGINSTGSGALRSTSSSGTAGPLPSEDLSATAELRKKLYLSLERRGFDGVCLFGASDDDVYDLVSNCPLGFLRAIRQISLRCCSVTDKGLETLMEALPGASQLELAGCNELTDAGLWASLGPRLVALSLADCINVADESVAAVAQLLPSLYELNLQAYHVTDAALAFFGPRQSTTLCVLRLRSCWELTNQGLLNLVHALPHLTVLSLSGCSKVSDDGVELIAENLKQLRSLDLSWCPRITDAALEYVACDLAHLEELTLDRCVHITDIGLGYLSTMVNLGALYLRWCSQVRDFGLQHLCSMRSLQILSLAGCPLLTCSGLSSLIQLRHLRELELTNCPGTSGELYEYLRENIPNCLIIE